MVTIMLLVTLHFRGVSTEFVGLCGLCSFQVNGYTKRKFFIACITQRSCHTVVLLARSLDNACDKALSFHLLPMSKNIRHLSSS